MARLDMAEILVNHGGAAVGGAVQRWAWDQDQNMGFIATGVAWAGGLFLESQMTGQMASLGRGLGYSGAAIGGWLVAEQLMDVANGRSVTNGNNAQARYLPGANVGGGLPRGNGFRQPNASNRRTTRAGDQLLFVVN